MDTAKAFIIALLVVAVIAFTLVIALGELSKATPNNAISVDNETTSVNVTEIPVALSVAGFEGSSCNVVRITNETDTPLFNSANFTFSQGDCTIAYSGGAANVMINNTLWNLTYTYTHLYQGSSGEVIGNVSVGTTFFFANATTWFTLLAVVVIILIISLVIFAVNRFGGSSSIGGGGSSKSGIPAGGGL